MSQKSIAFRAIEHLKEIADSFPDRRKEAGFKGTCTLFDSGYYDPNIGCDDCAFVLGNLQALNKLLRLVEPQLKIIELIASDKESKS